MGGARPAEECRPGLGQEAEAGIYEKDLRSELITSIVRPPP